MDQLGWMLAADMVNMNLGPVDQSQTCADHLFCAALFYAFHVHIVVITEIDQNHCQMIFAAFFAPHFNGGRWCRCFITITHIWCFWDNPVIFVNLESTKMNMENHFTQIQCVWDILIIFAKFKDTTITWNTKM